MTYAKNLVISKILVSAGLCLYVLMSFDVNIGNLMALPIMLWAVWGKKLHGTGRSVRLMAFLGLAFSFGFYLRAMPDSAHVVLGMDGNLVSASVVSALLLSGIIMSIRRSPDVK
ncbi:MAG: hypothetical protein L3J65_09185 [Robiginitomaculum sp.]|nr:hypothetical protein [Robiginitomaculum sp.]